jgi:hypothetical protein
VDSRFSDTYGMQKLSLNCIMSLNLMILYIKLKNGLFKIVTKSQVVTKFNVTISRLPCISHHIKYLWLNVVCMSSSDLLIWRNFEFWSTNICYCLLSAEKKFDWSTFFVGPIRYLFSQLKKRKQIFVVWNSKFRQISKSLDDIPRT